MNKASFMAIIVICTLLACNQPNKKVFPLPNDARELLTDSYKKTWKLAQRFNNDTRMNMAGCFLSYRLTLAHNMTLFDNNGLQENCRESLHANWKLVKDKTGHFYLRMSSPQIPKLMNIEDDFKLMKIVGLDEEKMVLQYYHKQFSNKTSTITDYYVPEHIEVKGRNFHW